MQPVTRTRTCIKLMYFIARHTPSTSPPATFCHTSFASLLLHMKWHALNSWLRNSCRGTILFVFFVLCFFLVANTIGSLALLPYFECDKSVQYGEIHAHVAGSPEESLQWTDRVCAECASKLQWKMCRISSLLSPYRYWICAYVPHRVLSIDSIVSKRWNCVDGRRCSVYRHYEQRNGCLLCFAHGFIQLLSVAIKTTVCTLRLDGCTTTCHIRCVCVVGVRRQQKMYIEK